MIEAKNNVTGDVNLIDVQSVTGFVFPQVYTPTLEERIGAVETDVDGIVLAIATLEGIV